MIDDIFMRTFSVNYVFHVDVEIQIEKKYFNFWSFFLLIFKKYFFEMIIHKNYPFRIFSQ